MRIAGAGGTAGDAGSRPESYPLTSRAFRLFFDNAPVALVVHDGTGGIIHANREALRELQRSLDDVLALNVTDILLIGGASIGSHAVHAIASDPSASFYGSLLRKDGARAPVEIDVRSHGVGDGLHYIVVFRKEEGELARNRDADRLARCTGKSGFWDYDIAHDILYCDRQWYRILGRNPANPATSLEEFKSFIHPDDAARVTEVDLTAATLLVNKQDYGIAFRIIRPDGEIRWVRSAACLLEDGSGRASRAMGFIVDVTEARQEGRP